MPARILFYLIILLSTNSASLIPITVINYYCPSLSIQSNDTIPALYDTIHAKLPSMQDISIVFRDKILLNVPSDCRTMHHIGISVDSNEIQIIKKMDCTALLETVSALGNTDNIPWFNQATHCIPAYHMREGVKCNDTGHIIIVDLSHLNLTGTVHLKSLPQSVRSLDLSFNDLLTLNLDELNGKSLEILNVEHNKHYRVNTNCFESESAPNLLLRVFQISSNQIFPEITDLKQKDIQIRKWLSRYQKSKIARLVVDGVKIYRGIRASPLCIGMLGVIAKVTNKEIIPWYQPFECGVSIDARGWSDYNIDYKRKRDGYPARYKFNLRGLGLEGHIDLGASPRNVVKLDLSDNNLSSISFGGEGKQCLEELNVRNNDNLRINLTEIEGSSVFQKFSSFVISSNQLEIDGITANGAKSEKIEFIRKWLMKRSTTINQVVVDDVIIDNDIATPPRNPVLHRFGMINVIERVTNKERIPWYPYFARKVAISPPWESFGILYPSVPYNESGIIHGNRFKRSRSQCHFDLSGLGLEGHIELGYLPKNVIKLDLSNNNLNSISFAGNGQYNLRELNVQNNDNLRIDLTKINPSSITCCLYRLETFLVSSNQLKVKNDNETLKRMMVRDWLKASRLKHFYVNNQKIK